MAKDQLSRKLAVLLHADVVGSTSLVQKNETLAHERIQDAFRRFSRTIVTHKGIAHEIRGDALVAEFTRVSDAISAAVDFQLANATHVEELQDEIRPIVRIGIAMGEVIVADNTVTGEGIVLAQRLEQLAGPGSVCIQGAVYETVPKRLPFVFENLGDHSLKGFEEPVSAYAVRHESDTNVVVTKATSLEDPVGADLFDKPSIAVLPFTNMSGDPEQEYFSDGISEDIITELARFNSLFVIARNSSFHYKGKSPKVQDVGRELGVQYVIEGSVRKSGNRVRITAQLVETQTGNHIWAQRYDRELIDIFEVQDEVTRAIVGIIPGRLDVAEARRSARKVPEEMKAYDMYLRGLQIFTHSQDFAANREELQRAKELFREAIKFEPGYARAHTYVALSLFNEYFNRYAGVDVLQEALTSVKTSIALDPTDNFAPAVLGLILIYLGRDDDGVTELTQALQLNSNNAVLLYWAGFALSFVGHSDSAVTHIKEAIRLDPFNKYNYIGLGFAFYLNGQFDDAVTAFRKIVRADWGYANACLAAAYGQLGRKKEARACAAQFALNAPKEFRKKDDSTIDNAVEIYDQAWRDYFPYSDWLDSILDGMRKAGL